MQTVNEVAYNPVLEYTQGGRTVLFTISDICREITKRRPTTVVIEKENAEKLVTVLQEFGFKDSELTVDLFLKQNQNPQNSSIYKRT